MNEHAGARPWPISDGWPDPIPGCEVLAQEASIAPGHLLLRNGTWSSMRGTDIVVQRLDADAAFVVSVPTEHLSDDSFNEWVIDHLPMWNRLLLWDATRSWWIVNDGFLELTLICAQATRFPFEFDAAGTDALDGAPFDWLAAPNGKLPEHAEHVVRRYGLL